MIESMRMMNWKRTLVSTKVIPIVALIVAVGSTSCRHGSSGAPAESQTELESEPEQYSATVVRTVVDGTSQQSTVTKEARAGELRREDWTEEGESRALIVRPDIGKRYVLDPDRQAYVEIDLSDGSKNPNGESQTPSHESKDSTGDPVQAVDRAIDDAQSPDRVETRALPSADVDGHICQVYEQRATFVDGHVEITKTFRAPDLDGLFLRTESSSEPPSVRIITERKDVTRDVAPSTFSVPSNFKRVDKLTR